ncbi:unnamed protein product [Caenorhabditis nigoni]
MATPTGTVQKEGKEPHRETDGSAFQFNLFADLLHGIHFDNHGRNNRRDWEELPTDSGMNSLVEFIGGFEKWNELNDDCRMAVVKYLEYNDRCKLGICSKRDYETVKSTPLDVYSISIKNNKYVDFDHVSVTVILDDYYNPINTISLIFSQLGEDTHVRWYEDYLKIHRDDDSYQWPERFSDSYKERLENRILVLKSCNYKEEAVKFAEKWMKKCNFELKNIDVEVKNYPMAKSQIKSLPRCKSIRFGADDVETFRWWIQKLSNQVENIRLVRLYDDQDVFTIPSDLLNAPQIMQTADFDFWCRADFSDEQFSNLKADYFSFHCVNIIDEGIRNYIRKWANGNGAPDFQRALLWTTEAWDFDEMTRGLECRQWQGDFENEKPAFCRFINQTFEPGLSVQIFSKVDPYESITLSVSHECVEIYKTGHKMENDGRPFTFYCLPP